MNTRKLFPAFILFILSITLISCNDNEVKDFILNYDSFDIPINSHRPVYIESGNRDYKIQVEKPDLLEVEIDLESPYGGGYINISPKEKGETTINITDNITQESYELKIKITDSCAEFGLGTFDHPALSTVSTIILRNNNEKNAYFLKWNGLTEQVDVAAEGKYSFSLEEGNRYLTLTYVSDENGKFTDAEIPPTPHTFLITKDEPGALYLLDNSLSLNWNIPNINSRESPPPTGYYMKIKETGTDYEVWGNVEKVPLIPVGLFD